MAYQKYKNRLSLKNKLGRLLWNTTYLFLFRPCSLPFFNHWRILLLTIFGAKIGNGCKIDSTVKIWAPWNLTVGHCTALGPQVECYNPGKIIIGNQITISQRSHLCTASHDYTLNTKPLITKPITIENQSWVATDAFIGMGITIGEGAIVGARAVVTKNVSPWTIVAGNPAKHIKNRFLEGSNAETK